MAVKDDYQDFKNALNDLKINSKPLINCLTILAEEKIPNAPQIVRAIEERILETKGDYVLPVLYVLDSIVKNLRSPTYIQLFEHKLPVIFASAFNKVDERTRSSMFKLRQTWAPYFSNAMLHNLDSRTHYIDPAWPITARIPDTSSSASTIHFNPDFIQRNATSSSTSTNQHKLPTKPEEQLRTGNQTNVKTSDTSSRDEAYHMIPIDRKEIESISNKDSNGEQSSRIKKDGNVPPTNNQDVSVEKTSNDKSSVNKTIEAKSDTTQNDTEVLFGGSDIDYRDTDVITQQKPTTTSGNSDMDRLIELNSECISLAEQKFKSKELSSEEYKATLKLLQNILQNQVQRLTTSATTSPSLSNNNNHTTTTTLANTVSTLTTTTPSNLFQSQSLQFPSSHPTTAPTALSTFPFAGFGNDTQRHAMQILAAVSASSSYGSHFNMLPFIPPLPPAPPPFTLLPNTFPSTGTTGAKTGRLSPSTKRPHDENGTNHLHTDEDKKRARYDLTNAHQIRSHNFDGENIAAVPSLLDANINTLKKKYLGVIQQLYIGKFQCRLCGLRFSAKQKHLYTHHLDWHYWQNRQAATTSSTLLERCRDWYPSLQEWTVYEENLDEQMRNNQMMLAQNRLKKDSDSKSLISTDIIACSANKNGDIDDDRCYVCHDPFENFFDDNREEWCLKDAIRVDEKTYHPICYQDVKFQATNEKPRTLFRIDPASLTDALIDAASDHSSDSQFVDNAMSSVNIKSENDDTLDKDLLSPSDASMKPTYLSSMSFVNLVESIFIKKEDLKPIENIEPVTINIKEELVDSTAMSEEIPFLSIKPENECEFLINKTSDGIGTISD